MSQVITVQVEADDDAVDASNDYLDELQSMITALNIKYISKGVVAEISSVG